METIKLQYEVDGDDFTRAGEASSAVKKNLRQLGVDPSVIRRVAISLYEGEINMVIHAHGGTIHVEVSSDTVSMILADQGPGIPNVEQAMQEGWSTAPDEVRSLGFGAGMGLSNMKKNSDEMKIDTTVGVGTTVTMKIKIKP